MALSADRDTPKRDGNIYVYPMAAATNLIYGGSLVVLDASGNAESGATASGKIAVGRAEEQKTNAGAAAAETIEVRAGTFRWANSVGDAVTKASIGDAVYIEDDQTVCGTAAGKSSAGIMTDIDSLGVWVKTEPPVVMLTGLLAANNLSEVTDATACTNIGLGAGDDVGFNKVTTVDDVVVGDDCTIAGLCTIAETLAVAGAATYLNRFSTQTATYTVVDGNGGEVIEDATDNAVITLPDCAATNKGQKVTVINLAATGAAKLSIDPDASDKIVGTIQAVEVTGVANKDIVNTKSTQVQGDYATLVSDGVDTWFVIGGVGVWAGE